MRITPEAKQRTRERILASARTLFATRGFAATTTRDLATRADIAAGTLFNYFPTKEDLAAELLAQAAEEAEAAFLAERRAGASLEEDLFALEAANLRAVEPLRAWAGEALERGLGPLLGPGQDGEARLRAARLGPVRALLAQHGRPPPLAATLHLYWTLALGALAFRVRDPSPHGEETLALLDRSLRLFVRSLGDEERQP